MAINNIHTSMDLETLGTRPGVAILSIGACRFDMDTGETMDDFYATIDMKSCFDIGLTFECSTLQWWMNQSQEARGDTFKGEFPIHAALHSYAAWYRKSWQTMGPFWCHGATFDPPILAHAYYRAGITLPWDFRLARDTRTIFALAGDITISRKEGVHHNALSDSKNQAAAIVEANRKIKGTAKINKALEDAVPAASPFISRALDPVTAEAFVKDTINAQTEADKSLEVILNKEHVLKTYGAESADLF